MKTKSKIALLITLIVGIPLLASTLGCSDKQDPATTCPNGQPIATNCGMGGVPITSAMPTAGLCPNGQPLANNCNATTTSVTTTCPTGYTLYGTTCCPPGKTLQATGACN